MYNILFGVSGLKSLAVFVKEECSFFIENNLSSNLTLIYLYNARIHKVKYLGFDVKILEGSSLKSKEFLNFSFKTTHFSK